MNVNLYTGIDVGTTKICTLVAQELEDGSLQIIGVGIEPSRGMKRGVVVNVEEAARAIAASVDKAQRTAGYEIASAVVSLAGAQVSSINSRGVVGVAGEIIAAEDVARASEAARAIAVPYDRQIVHVLPRGFVVDGQEGIRNPVGMHGFRLEMETHIITASSTALRNLAQCVQICGVEVEGFVLNPIASADAVLRETERDMGVGVVDIGGGTTDLALYHEGTVSHTAVLPVGGNHVTADIAHGLRMPAEVAESIKLAHGHTLGSEITPGESFMVRLFGEEAPAQVLRSDLVSIIQPRMEEIFSMVAQEIERVGMMNYLPAGIVLTGGASLLPGVRMLASQTLGLPVRVAGPGELKGLVDQLNSPAYATSVGLLIWLQKEVQGMASARPAHKPRTREGTDVGKKVQDFIKTILKGMAP
ncbi:MAG: cell division protein FtsA [Anaerolineales bacterium]|nr:cell division protein FtsA [Anaerolineales bacterium]